MPNLMPGGVLEGEGFLSLERDFLTDVMMPPITAGLVGCYFMTALSKKGHLHNYADPTRPLTERGRPDLWPTFARTDSNNCFDTGLKLSRRSHVFAIVRPPSPGATNAQKGMPFSDWVDAPPPRGLAVEMSATDTRISMTGYLSYTDGTNKAAGGFIDYPTPDDFQIVMMGYYDSAYAGAGIYDPNTGQFVINTFPNPGSVTVTDRTLLLGGNYSTREFQGKQDVVGALVYDGIKMVPADYAAIGQFIRNVMGPQVGIWRPAQ
ncbi:DUF11 domain-containing protein [Serratia entomophila]|uniref:DUF11 domain-containing protein n=1 Tax=Serratia entomophila TaxID=42906 RepID=UPI00217C0BBD|nr:DUF11 domain-containing protein [Serratia entomophila]CAI0730736.1 Uncharacterised protein [Serratia entomophila]CAI1697150.1 Uncharacterised protein [Serratia entomophila]CAI2447138.1 Uncharacterised protein [Serratia entomophila]